MTGDSRVALDAPSSSALELNLRALRPILERSRGHGTLHQPPAARPSSRPDGAGSVEPLPFADFDWCRRLGQADRELHPPADR